jgi:trans-2,3-dihydro-3-hydroxyanthranilate isomerase
MRSPAGTLPFTHLDVFAARPYTGNSLAVVVDPPPLTAGQCLAITRELRHFETIFVSAAAGGGARARVFDLERELDFAGHPVLGAAALLHDLDDPGPGATRARSITLAARAVTVETTGDLSTGVLASLDQGRPELIGAPPAAAWPEIAASLGLAAADLDPDLPPEVVSTGLRYLIVPVRSGDVIGRARISRPDFGGFLAGHGAEFAYVLDAAAPEGRHWNNDGILEDVATGSAAGCVAAYLLRHQRIRAGETAGLHQGRFTGRPSRIEITAFGDPASVDRVVVAGRVVRVAEGWLAALPPEAA